MSTEASAVSMAVDAEPAVHGGLYSPPESTNAPKPDASDSELSDLEETEDDIGEITPDHYADDGRVPVFKPTYHQFKSFTVYMNKINHYGMRSGIVKVIPPEEWKAEQPNLDEAIKTIRVKEPIKQDIMGTNGTYRQANILHQRSYNLPQWRALCEQSEHQPPAKRGERRANAEKYSRAAPRTTRTSTPAVAPPGTKRKPGRPRKTKAKKGEEDADDSTLDRLPTPVSPREEDELSIKEEVLDQDDTPARPKGGRQPKPTTASVSARRKNNRRDAVGKIDEAAFKDFDYRTDGSEFTPARCEELERAYWRTLTYAPPLYGADMPGTLFDDRTKAWNLGKLENLLDVLGTKIPGVNTAYLYLGMWKATFAWHLEDVDLYSINYNHFGAPKQWYSIAQGDARRFEEAMKQIFPTDAKACDQFLRHKTFLISPTTLLNNHNIRVNRVVHHPGEFVITFPYGYHSGYNLGYNCAEAVNFALDSWLEYGRIAKKCECDQAQDSVWIDVSEIERKLRGEKTPEYYEVTDDEDDEDEDDEEDIGLTDLPTPPDSSGDAVKIKPVRSRKRKRDATDKDDKAKIKKVRRIGKVGRQPCCLCPNDFPFEPLLPTDNGKQAHRRCGVYIPETDIETESGTMERIVHVNHVTKARLELKCGYCSLKVGACFQCSRKKCTRAFHPTCAAAAGVFVEQGQTSVWGEDGTEYKVPEIQFSCKFHRVKRDKKLTMEDLEKDSGIREAALKLKKGDLCQFQYLESKEWFGGSLVENRMDEGMLLVDILPYGDRVEVEYKWLMIGQPGDYNIIPPSPHAIPIPRVYKFATTKRQTDDLPRPDDKFGDSDFLVWKEFNQCDPPKNPEQVKVDLSKENQVWYYLGRYSTEARAQFTEDIIHKPRHNPKGLFMETVPKPTYTATSATPRQSYPASHPSQNTTSAARVRPQPPQPTPSARSDKPYTYKPRVPADVAFVVDPQALNQQRKYVSAALGNVPNNTPQNWRPPNNNMNFLPPSIRESQSSSGNTAGRTINHSPFGTRTYGATSSDSGRRGSTNARSGRLNPFARYAYLQAEHNRSPLEYKSPYNPNGGFMNGYEGSLIKHLQNTPNALTKYISDTSRQSSSPSALSSSMSYNKMHNLSQPRTSYGRHPEQASYLSSSAPYQSSNTNTYGPRSTAYASSSSIPSRSTGSPAPTQHKYAAEHSQHRAHLPQSSLPPLTATKSNANSSWEKKDPVMHPAIRKDYMFHHQYHQPNSSPTLPRPQNLPPSKPELHKYKPQQFQPPMRSEMPMPQFQSPKQSDAQVMQRNPYQSPVTEPTATHQELHHHPSPVQYEMPVPKPVYPHQQYFQKPHQPTEYADPPPTVTLPIQLHQEIYQQLPPLQQIAPILLPAEEPLANKVVAECPPDMSSFTKQLMENLKKAAS